MMVCFLPNSALAVDDGFTIRALIGDDSIPPTTPVLLSAVPVADSQIDLAWTASTDNFSLDGYVVLRDGISIATTTLTSFSDTGLTAETLYLYEVYAFDSYLNISTTSNSISTTTLPIPPPPSVSTSADLDTANQTSTKTVVFRNINIETSIHEAYLNWETYGLSKYTLLWGTNSEYTDGYINNNTFRNSHQTNISGLTPDTVYFYKIIGHTPLGASVVLNEGQFKTLVEVSNFPPPNVLRFGGEVRGNDVFLSWQLPDLTKIKSVRVVSSPYGYPVNINDGEVVYEGLDLSILDKDALLHNYGKYYTAFVIDEKGIVSSGAVVFVTKKDQSITKEFDRQIDSGKKDEEWFPYTEPSSKQEEISLYNFDTNNIKIFQDNHSLTFVSEAIALSYKKPFTISIPYESLPRHLKSIIVTLLDPTDNRRSYSFLLKINKEGTAYEATIASLNVLGASRLEVEIFDFESELIGLYKKPIVFSLLDETKIEDKEVVFPDKILYTTKDLTLIILTAISVILLLLLTFRFLRRV